MTTVPEIRPCTGCVFAKWSLTKGGKLHPSGDGRCMWFSEVIGDREIPPVFYYIGASQHMRQTVPSPAGGFINRREPVVCRFRIDEDATKSH